MSKLLARPVFSHLDTIHLVTVLAPLVVLLVQLLWQVDVGNDDGVDGAGGLLGLSGPVAAWVVLVLALSAGLPGAAGVGNLLLGGGGGGRASKVESSATESSDHDGAEDHELGVPLGLLL